MTHLYEQELRAKAEQFIVAVERLDIGVTLKPVMFRDYMVKLEVATKGYLQIFYSPRKASFSLKTHELRDKNCADRLQACWNQLEAAQTETTFRTPYQAYVDGSYVAGKVGYGAVIIHEGKEIARLSGEVLENIEQRQVSGELTAVLEVLRWCGENGVTAIDIVYDLEGIEKWATSEWKANTPLTQHFVATIEATSIEPYWHKVTSHTGVYWNDVADVLAKQAASSPSDSQAEAKPAPMEILHQTAQDFVTFLLQQGITAEFRQIYNNQYARIVIEGGFFDLYNTTKRPLIPHIHQFRNPELQDQVNELWRHFLAEHADPERASTDAEQFEEVEYYLRYFEPYRHTKMDFTPLAQALARLVDDIDPMMYSTDFDQLETIYKRIRGIK